MSNAQWFNYKGKRIQKSNDRQPATPCQASRCFGLTTDICTQDGKAGQPAFYFG
jgi:hypothetical protein